MKSVTPQFAGTNYQLPSVQWFIDTAADDLSSRRSVLVLVPAGISVENVWSLVRSRLWARNFDFREALLPELPNRFDPVLALGSLFQVEYPGPEAPRSAESIIDLSQNLPDVVYLDGFSELTVEEIRAWLAFLKDWVGISHSKADQGHQPMAFCVITQAKKILKDIPKTDIHLGVYWWWGFPSALEVKLLCRGMFVENEDNALSRWREFLIPALAGSDIALAAHLWDGLQDGVESIFCKLVEYSDIRGWGEESLKSWGAGEIGDDFMANNTLPARAPSEQIRQLWAQGAVNLTPEYGVRISTPALVSLGRKGEVLHRLWRGQAELLLPVLDQVRLFICNRLTGVYGKSWPYRWIQPSSEEEKSEVRNDPMACQLGYLEHLLRTCRALRSEKAWIPLVSRARLIRNDLAHYRPVDFSHFRAFMREVGQAFGN